MWRTVFWETKQVSKQKILMDLSIDRLDSFLGNQTGQYTRNLRKLNLPIYWAAFFGKTPQASIQKILMDLPIDVQDSFLENSPGQYTENLDGPAC